MVHIVNETAAPPLLFLFDMDDVLVRYDWNVVTTKPWMNLLAPVARPLFKWNHDAVMNWGAEGLARRLGVERMS